MNKHVKIKEKIGRPQGKFRFLKYKEGTNELISASEWCKNLVLNSSTTGIGLIAKQLIGVTTYPLEITSAEIGTGSNAPVDSDTNLQTPVVTGILRSNQEALSDIVTLRFFIAAGVLPNGTYKEFLLRCGTQAFARALINPPTWYTKAAGEDTIVEYVINLTN